MHYRKIWEKYNKACLLPGIEIHHIDGNRDNNDPLNLLAVTVEEHYNIHLQQNDINAAAFIAERLNIDTNTYRILKQNAGKLCADRKTGFHKLTSEEKSLNGRIGGLKTVSNKSGIFSEDYDRKNTGLMCRDKKLGFHGLTSDERKKISSLATKGRIWIINSDGIRKRILPSQLNEFIIKGFKEGMSNE